MRRLRSKLRSRRGLTLVETLASVCILSLLAMMLSTGLLMARSSYDEITGDAESQALLSTLVNLLSNELRFARDVVTDGQGDMLRYTSVNYGRNTMLSLDDERQLQANERRMLASGAYGNGAYWIDSYSIRYDGSVFQVSLRVSGEQGIFHEAEFAIRCLNGSGRGTT